MLIYFGLNLPEFVYNIREMYNVKLTDLKKKMIDKINSFTIGYGHPIHIERKYWEPIIQNEFENIVK